jgi:hypothetical protein
MHTSLSGAICSHIELQFYFVEGAVIVGCSFQMVEGL